MGNEPAGTISAEQEIKITGKSAVIDWYEIEMDGEKQYVSGSLIVYENPQQSNGNGSGSGSSGSGSSGGSSQPSGGSSGSGGNGGSGSSGSGSGGGSGVGSQSGESLGTTTNGNEVIVTPEFDPSQW